MVNNNSDQIIETFSNQLLGEEFISIVELGNNDIPYEIINLKNKDNQGSIKEINNNTDHNPSLEVESSKHNEGNPTEFVKNNYPTRHAVVTSHGVEKEFAEIKVKEDDDCKEGTDENIGHQKRILSQN